MVRSLIFVAFLLTFALAARADEALDRITKTHILRVAFDNAVFSETPLVMRHPNTGELSGIEVSLIHAIARDLGAEVKWVNAKWSRLIAKVRSQEADVAIQQIFSPTVENRVAGDAYSQSYLSTGLAMVTKKSSLPIHEESLKESKGITFNDDVARKFLRKQGFKNLLFADSDREVLEGMKTGKFEFMIFDLPLVINFIKQNGEKFGFLHQIIPGSAADYAAVLRDDSPKLLEKVNESIAKWKASSERKSLRDKYDL